MELIIRVARQFKRHLLIASRKLGHISAKDITVTEYLPLPDLMNHAGLVIHHGGANIFSEAIRAGARQILIPLTTDQPIQGELLNRIQAGITIRQDEVSEENLQSAFQQLLDPDQAIHHHIRKMRDLSQQANGAINAATLIEKTALGVQIS
jgi:UDP:flavonoid glycosyltransferase YjiC (YdhE family)